MAYQMYLFSTDGLFDFDITELVHSIQYTTSLKGYAGKLTFVMEKDTAPASMLEMKCGYAIAFRNNDIDVFYGYIFTLGTDRTGAYKVTAYDQMRYLQNHGFYIIDNEAQKNTNLKEVFENTCTDLGINGEINSNIYLEKLNSVYLDVKLRNNVFIDVSAYDFIQNAINEVSLGGQQESTSTGLEAFISNQFASPYFFIRDRFGKLELNEIRANAQVIKVHRLANTGAGFQTINGIYIGALTVIGDESLLTDYQYELSIDKDTYNRIHFIENTKNGTGEKVKNYVDKIEDKDTQKKWGVLQKVVTVRHSDNEAELKNYMKLALVNSNRVSKSLTLKAIGIDPLYAGDAFVLDLPNIGVKQIMYITQATHNYDADIHTMSLEVQQSPTLTEKL